MMQLPLLPLGVFGEAADSSPPEGMKGSASHALEAAQAVQAAQAAGTLPVSSMAGAQGPTTTTGAETHQKTLAEQKSDFTAEGAPPPSDDATAAAKVQPVDTCVAPLHCIRDT